MPEDNAIVRFYPEAKYLKYKSEASGHAVYDNRDYVEITFPGQDKAHHVREVTEADKARWPRQWAAYKANQEQVPDGTPLSTWPQLNPAQLKMLQSEGFQTVEQLEGAPDVNLQGIMGGLDLRKRAQKFLAELVPAAQAAAIEKRTGELFEEAEQIHGKADAMRVHNDTQAHEASALKNVLVETLGHIAEHKLRLTDHYDQIIKQAQNAKSESLAKLVEATELLKPKEGDLQRRVDAWNREVAKAKAENPTGEVTRVINTEDTPDNAMPPPPHRKSVEVQSKAAAVEAATANASGDADDDSWFDVDTTKD